MAVDYTKLPNDDIMEVNYGKLLNDDIYRTSNEANIDGKRVFLKAFGKRSVRSRQDTLDFIVSIGLVDTLTEAEKALDRVITHTEFYGSALDNFFVGPWRLIEKKNPRGDVRYEMRQEI